MRRMKHSGKAAQAALRLIWWTLVLLLAVLATGVIAHFFSEVIAGLATTLVAVWVLFALFTFYFFRDPEPVLPSDAKAIVSPAHGTVDVIDETTEAEVHGRPLPAHFDFSLRHRRARAERAGERPARLLPNTRPANSSARPRPDCAEHNENVLLGFEPDGLARPKDRPAPDRRPDRPAHRALGGGRVRP